jgi:prepilin-type N-terminal cleavage/methylation domain-containing protein
MIAGPRGYSLVELLIAVVLLAILAGVMVPCSGNTDASQLRGGAIVVARDIQHVQSEAINSGRNHEVEFVRGNRYQVWDPDGAGVGRAARLPHPQSDYPAHDGEFIVDFDDPGPLRGLEIASANFGGQSKLAFGRYGEPSAGGEIVLVEGRHQVRITVAPITGFVSISDLEEVGR